MKRLAACLILLLAACEAKKDDAKASFDLVRKEARETLEAATNLARQQRDSVQLTLLSKLEAIDAKIEALRILAQTKTGEARAEVEVRIQALEKKRSEVQAKVSELKTKSTDAFDAAKAGIDEALEDLEEAYDEVKEDLK